MVPPGFQDVVSGLWGKRPPGSLGFVRAGCCIIKGVVRAFVGVGGSGCYGGGSSVGKEFSFGD